MHKSPIVQWFTEDSLRKLLHRLILRRRVSREGQDSVEESLFVKSDFSGRVEESLFCNKYGGKSTSLIFLLYALIVEEGKRTGSHIEIGKLFGSHLVNILPQHYSAWFGLKSNDGNHRRACMTEHMSRLILGLGHMIGFWLGCPGNCAQAIISFLGLV